MWTSFSTSRPEFSTAKGQGPLLTIYNNWSHQKSFEYCAVLCILSKFLAPLTFHQTYETISPAVI